MEDQGLLKVPEGHHVGGVNTGRFGKIVFLTSFERHLTLYLIKTL